MGPVSAARAPARSTICVSGLTAGGFRRWMSECYLVRHDATHRGGRVRDPVAQPRPGPALAPRVAPDARADGRRPLARARSTSRSAALAHDYATWTAASIDDGATWSEPRRLAPFEPADGPDTHSVRITRAARRVVRGRRWALEAVRTVRARPEPRDERLVPHGPGRDALSADGRTWSPFEVIDAAAGRAVASRSATGSWRCPTVAGCGPSPRGRAGTATTGDGLRAVALVSPTRAGPGRRTSTCSTPGRPGIAHWEQSIVPLPDGRLLAVGWAFDPATSRDRTSCRTRSPRHGASGFTVRGGTGLRAQTTKLCVLPDGRVLAVYRRDDQPGLWATVARIDGDRWVTLAEAPLWEGARVRDARRRAGPSRRTSPGSRSGRPTRRVAEDGSVLVALLGRRDCVYGIDWVRLRIRLTPGPRRRCPTGGHAASSWARWTTISPAATRPLRRATTTTPLSAATRSCGCRTTGRSSAPPAARPRPGRAAARRPRRGPAAGARTELESRSPVAHQEAGRADGRGASSAAIMPSTASRRSTARQVQVADGRRTRATPCTGTARPARTRRCPVRPGGMGPGWRQVTGIAIAAAPRAARAAPGLPSSG